MLCPKCGWTNPDDSAQCANCQAELTRPLPPQPEQQPPVQPYPQQPMPPVPNYLAWSIVVTVLSALMGTQCCFSMIGTAFGIVSIIKASQANTKAALGQYAAAMEEALAAKTWMIWSAVLWGVGAVVLVVGMILYFVFVMVMVSHTPSGFVRCM